MPKLQELAVAAGDRDSLLRYALVARLTETIPEDRLRRGAPVPPSELHRSSRWLNSVLFGEGPLRDSDVTELIDAVEKDAPRDRRELRDLATTFRAATNPRRVAAGVVDARFWPTLRRVPVSRHPVDLVIAGYCAANHLLETGATGWDSEQRPRDVLAIERVGRGLAIVALGGYPFSSNAIDLLAVLARWTLKPFDAVGTHSGRRLTRALDRAVRAYLPLGDVIGTADRKWFDDVVGIAVNAVKPPHTAASSSSAAIRLARLALLRHPDPFGAKRGRKAKPVCVPLIEHLERAARGEEGVTDVLLRREAMWYLAEARPLVDEAAAISSEVLPIDKLLEDRCGAAHEHGLFDDLRLMLPTLDRHRTIEKIPQLSPTWANNFDDFAPNPLMSGPAWEAGRAIWKPTLDQHLTLGKWPRSTSWRRLTSQVAVPTVELLYELLFTPWSARARWIAQTIRAAGAAVVDAVADTFLGILRDDDALANQIVAKRTAWAIGLIVPPSSVLLRALVAASSDAGLAPDVSTDLIWAIGDFIAARGDDPFAGVAMDTLRQIARQGVEDARSGIARTRRTDTQALNVGPLLRIQASVHAIAIQHDSSTGDFLNDILSDATVLLEDLGPVRARFPDDAAMRIFGRQADRTTHTAEWALRQVDAAVALSLK